MSEPLSQMIAKTDRIDAALLARMAILASCESSSSQQTSCPKQIASGSKPSLDHQGYSMSQKTRSARTGERS
jgi:nitrous oxide reductase accessory protein NosL